jgi:hypothetical protein
MPRGEERLQVLDAKLLQTVRAADFLLSQTVVVADLPVARDHPDVTQAVELRADLPDLAHEQLVVIVEVVLAERPAGRRARQDDVGAESLAEQRNALFEHVAELVHLPGLDELGRFENLRRRHPVVRAALILRSPRRGPPLGRERIRGLCLSRGDLARGAGRRHACRDSRREPRLDEVASGNILARRRVPGTFDGVLAGAAALRLEVLLEPTRLHRSPPRR